MSRLATRVRRLEARLGPCRLCAERPSRIELINATTPASPAESEPDEFCPACGGFVELIRVVLAYDVPPPQPATGVRSLEAA